MFLFFERDEGLVVVDYRYNRFLARPLVLPPLFFLSLRCVAACCADQAKERQHALPALRHEDQGERQTRTYRPDFLS